jgi:hypothetical protein
LGGAVIAFRGAARPPASLGAGGTGVCEAVHKGSADGSTREPRRQLERTRGCGAVLVEHCRQHKNIRQWNPIRLPYEKPSFCGLPACLLFNCPVQARGITSALRPLRGECPAAVAAGRGYPAALLRALPTSAASACRTPETLRLSSGLSFSLSCTRSCARVLPWASRTFTAPFNKRTTSCRSLTLFSLVQFYFLQSCFPPRPVCC